MSPPDLIQQTSPSWWVGNWGNIASVAGLAIGVWVLITATKAKQLVIQVKHQLNNRNISKDLQEMREQLVILKTIVNDKNWASAQLLCHHLLDKSKFIENRWSELILETNQQSFNLISQHLKLISTQVSKFHDRPPSPKENTAINNVLILLSSTLSCEIGKFENLSDASGGSND